MFEAVEGWGAEMPFEGMTEFMMSGTLPVSVNCTHKLLQSRVHKHQAKQNLTFFQGFSTSKDLVFKVQ